MLDGMRLIGLDPSHRIRLPYSVITIRFSLTGNVGGNGAHGKWRFSFIDAFNLSPYSFLVLFLGLKIRTSSALFKAVDVVAAVVAGAHVVMVPSICSKRASTSDIVRIASGSVLEASENCSAIIWSRMNLTAYCGLPKNAIGLSAHAFFLSFLPLPCLTT